MTFRKWRRAVIERLKNAGLFLLASAHVVFFGARRRAPKNPSKIAILQGAKLGDMVCTTPLFHAIKKRFPHARLVVLGDAVNQKLLHGHPEVDKYIVIGKSFWSAARVLAREHADFGVLPLPSLYGLTLLIAGGVKAIAAPKIVGGYSPYETRTYKKLLRAVIAIPHYNERYVPREYLRLLEPIGIKSDDTTKRLTYTAEAKASVNAFFEKQNIAPERDVIVGILPGVGGDPIKRWAPEKFAAVADYLAQKHGGRILVLGVGSDAQEVEKMMRAVKKETSALNTLNRFSLEELKAIIASFSLFISADTGPVYIAEAFGTPTIDIVGPMYENIQPPQGKFHRTVAAPREKPALGILDNTVYNAREARRQSEDITVEMVARVADELILLSRNHEISAR
ncbi:MAG: glycosyl transferase, family 9 [Parcubacteria group bacterium Gr01-1014_17]|nr:MAG: glycosyl transferase, family 9 [Parcubacteria group bacterium Gr01-1014_17]